MKMTRVLAVGLVSLGLTGSAFAEFKINVQDKRTPLAQWLNVGVQMHAAQALPNTGHNPVRSDGTQLVNEVRGQATERPVSGRCDCLEYTEVGKDNSGNPINKCTRNVWKPGTVYRDVPITRYYRIVDPESYAKNKASSAGLGTGIGVGLGLGAAAALVTGLGLRFLAKTKVPVAGASAAIAGVAVAIGSGMYFGSKAQGPAYDEALHRARTNPDLPPQTTTESTPVRSFDTQPPLYGNDCSLLGR